MTWKAPILEYDTINHEFTISIDTPPLQPAIEPRIGPGMILERGRERVYIPRAADKPGRFYRSFVRKGWFGQWPAEWEGDAEGRSEAYFRYLLLSGFRVIRQADPEKPNPSPT